MGCPGRRRHHLGVGDQTGHLDGEVGGFGEGKTLCLTGVGDGEVDVLDVVVASGAELYW